jgi:hypothetical protein
MGSIQMATTPSEQSFRRQKFTDSHRPDLVWVVHRKFLVDGFIVLAIVADQNPSNIWEL